VRDDNSIERTPERSVRRRESIPVTSAFCVFAAVFCGFLSSARAGTLVDFTPQPASPGVAEVIWNQDQLYQGPGAIGTNFRLPGIGDGNLPVSQQFAPGLALETPYVVAGLPGSVVNANNNSTTFYDASLLIIPSGSNQRGLPAVGPTQITNMAPNIDVFSQLLGPGQFEIWTTQPDFGSGSVLLLGGTINSAVLTGLLNSTAGSLVSADITFSSGAILDAAEGLPLDGTAQPKSITGGLSWSLMDASPQFQLGLTGGGLAAFQANVTGQFSSDPVPEPGSVMLLLSTLPIAFFARRRWLGGRR
jgi:hypothetical protein